MYLSGYIEESIVDGPHVRTVVFISGCKHKCKNCHNPETWDFKYGNEFTLEKQIEIANIAKNNPLVKGLTISGGDPIYSYKEVIDFIKIYKSINPNHDIWLYTGFLYDDILNSEYKEILNYINVLVDGLYDESKRNLNLKFRGSSNQNIIYIDNHD